MAPRTLYDKLWDAHLVSQREDGTALLYIDRHLIHEVTSPQAFEGLALAGRKPWRLAANLAVPDHNVSTDPAERRGGYAVMKDAVSRIQLQTLDDNCERFGIREIRLEDTRQAVAEARLSGLVPFCLTVDREAPAYMPAVFGPRGYALLRRQELLPGVLVEVVRRLLVA